MLTDSYFVLSTKFYVLFSMQSNFHLMHVDLEENIERGCQNIYLTQTSLLNIIHFTINIPLHPSKVTETVI